MLNADDSTSNARSRSQPSPPKIFRSMLAEEGRPRIGNDAKSLGARVPDDIRPDANGNVLPNMGGMSVSPSAADLPLHRIPKRLRPYGLAKARGDDKLFVWSFGSGKFTAGDLAKNLTLRLDPEDSLHGLVEPDLLMSLAAYQSALANTRLQWLKDEPV